MVLWNWMLIIGVISLSENLSTVEGDATLLEARQHEICSYQIDKASLNGFAEDVRADCFLRNLSSAAALAIDIHDQVMIFSDVGEKVTYKVDIRRTPPVKEPVMHGWGKVEGIAVDWTAKNIFWTDSVLQHVAVSRYDGSHRHIIIYEAIGEPKGIALYPPKGYLFWSDTSPLSARIERTDMTGQHREVLVAYSVVSPNGLTVDHDRERLYYVDSGNDNIEYTDFDGNRGYVDHRSRGDFFGVAYTGNYLFVTSYTEGTDAGSLSTVFHTEEDTRFMLHTVSHPGYSTGLAVNDVTTQPTTIGQCGTDNGGCEQLCLPKDSASFNCSCGTGYTLNKDGLTCSTVLLPDPFLLVGDTSLNRILQVDASSAYSSYSAIPLEGTIYPTGIAYDPVDAVVYWTDRTLGRVSRASLNGTGQEVIAFENIEGLAGVAVDPVRRQVFWADEGAKVIEKAHLDGSQRTGFVRTGLEKPGSVAVNHLSGDLFWSDWGALPKIERISEDGSDRKVLVNSTNLSRPNGIAVDSEANLLYWCDAGGDASRIGVVSLDGRDRRILINLAPSSHPFSLAIHGEELFYTDWQENALSSLERFNNSPRARHFGPKIFLRMHGIASSYYVSQNIPALPSTVVPPAAGSNNSKAPPTSVELPTIIIVGGGACLVVFICLTIATLFLRQRTKARRRTTLQPRRPSRQPSIPIPPTPVQAGAMAPAPEKKMRLPSDDMDPGTGEHVYMDLDNMTAYHDAKGAPPPYSPPRPERSPVFFRSPPRPGRDHVFSRSPERFEDNPAFIRSPPYPNDDHVFFENPSALDNSDHGNDPCIDHSYYRYQDQNGNEGSNPRRASNPRPDSIQDTYNPAGDDAEYQTSITPLVIGIAPDYMDLSNSPPANGSTSNGRRKKYSIPSEYIEHNPARARLDIGTQNNRGVVQSNTMPLMGRNRVASNGVALRDDPVASSEARIRRERERSRIEANLRRSGYTSP